MAHTGSHPQSLRSLVWVFPFVAAGLAVWVVSREGGKMNRVETNPAASYVLPAWAAPTKGERDKQVRQENVAIKAMAPSFGTTIVRSGKGVGAPAKGDIDLQWVLNHGGMLDAYGPRSSDPLWAIDGDVNTCWTSAPTGSTYWSLTLDRPRNVQIEIVSQTGSGAVETSSDGVTWSKANTRSVATSGEVFVQEVVDQGKIRAVRINAFYGMHLGAPFFLKEVRLHTAQ